MNGSTKFPLSSPQKLLLFPITTSTCCLFMCCQRLMNVVLQCQNQDAFRSALRRPATSQNNAGLKHPDRPRSVFRQDSSTANYKRSASTALAGTHHAIGADPSAGRGPFPKPRALVLSMVRFGHTKPDGLDHIDTADSNLMHHQYRLSVLQWNPGPARRKPTNIIAATCGRLHAVILQEASDHVPHITDQFIAYIGNVDLAILLNKDTFEPDPAVFAFNEASTSKDTWGMVLLIVRGLLRRSSLSGTPTVTFCSIHIHNVVAKKRDASTDLLRRLHGYMHQHNVGFIGGDAT